MDVLVMRGMRDGCWGIFDAVLVREGRVWRIESLWRSSLYGPGDAEWMIICSMTMPK